MTTPAELTGLLAGLGFDVDEPTQEEWRKKSLLPALVSRQRPGQPKIRDYFYTELRIIERTILVKRLLDASHSADATLLAVWIKGFEVDENEVREAWIRLLDRFQDRIAKRIVDAEAKGQHESDTLERIRERVSREHARRNDIPRNIIEQFVDVIVRSVWYAAFVFGEDELENTKEDFGAYLKRLDLLPYKGSEVLPSLNIEVGADGLHTIVSLDALMSLARTTSASDLVIARKYWLLAVGVLTAIITIFVPGLAKFQPDPRHDPGILVGSVVIPILLYGIKGDRGQQIEASINYLLEIGQRIDIADAIGKFAHSKCSPEEVAILANLFDGIAKTWGFNSAAELLLRPQRDDQAGTTD